MPQITSIQIGRPKTYDPDGKPWTTGFFKQPVSGPIQVENENLVGDGQADRRVHGGPDKAVLAYCGDHYPLWQQELDVDFPPGAFGENLTISEMHETNVCLGDTYQIGSVRLQVTQPRQPCWKLARRWDHKLLPKLVVKTGRSGWYFRVIQTGRIEAGMEIELVERIHENWSIERANQAMYQGASATELMELVSLPEVSPAWIKDLPA